MINRLLVFFQFAGIALTCLETASAVPPFKFGFLAISLAGALLGLYTLAFNRIGNFNITPTLRENASLIVTGPYKLIRHPMYLSVLLFLVGLGLQAGTLLGWAGVCISASAMFQKADIEEKYLADRFPEYKDYQSRTKRIIPFVY